MSTVRYDTSGDLPAWASPETSQDERAARLNRIIELGISKHYLAELCGVEPTRITEWQKSGTPTRAGTRSMEGLDRFGGLLDHMIGELGLSSEEAIRFLSDEQNDYDHQDDDQDFRARWRSARLVSAHSMQDVGLKAIVNRLQIRYPSEYERLRAESEETTVE